MPPLVTSLFLELEGQNFTPYNGSRLNERRLPVWREEYCSFKKLLSALLFSFVLDTFQAISVNFFKRF